MGASLVWSEQDSSHLSINAKNIKASCKFLYVPKMFKLYTSALSQGLVERLDDRLKEVVQDGVLTRLDLDRRGHAWLQREF